MTEEGALNLFRGLGPVLIGSAPEMAVQITAYEVRLLVWLFSVCIHSRCLVDFRAVYFTPS